MPSARLPVRLALFGSPTIRRGEALVTGRAAYRRRLALLAVLAAARGRPVARDRLLGLLWAEREEDAARHSLSESLYVLRKELGEGALVAAGADVALEPARVGSDLEDFQRALEEGRSAEAAALYAAPFLEGFYVDDAPEFERWAEAERDRLARAFAAAVEGLAEAAEEAEDWPRAAAWWRRLAAHDPYGSRFALRLVEALGQGGEAAAALRHAEAHAAFLREELGVGLDPELAAAVERLREATVPLPPRPVAAPGVDPGSKAEARGEHHIPAAPFASPAPSVRTRGRWGWRSAGLVLAASGVVVAAALLRSPGTPAPPSPPDPHRIAVLYFDDHSAGRELEYLAGGLTESLIHALAGVDALEVISRNGVKPFRDGTVPLDSVAARLGAGSLVEGSVQRFGDSVRMTVQLIDAGTLAHLDSRVVVRPLGEVLALQDALAEEVAGALRRRLGREVRLRRAEAEAGSPAALDLVLRAQQLRADASAAARGGDRLDAASGLALLARADSLLARAEEAAPRWERPSILRGWTALQGVDLESPARQGAGIDAAEARAEGVLVRLPRSAAALELRAGARWRRVLAGGDSAGLGGAEADLRAVLAAEPGRAAAWGTLSQVLLARGRFGEAEAAALRALEADAYLEEAPMLLRRLYFSAIARADHPAAWEACGRGARMFPDDWHFVECRLTLLRADASRPPRPAEAWRLVAELERLDPPAAARAAGRGYAPVYRRMAAAAVSARAGDAARARAVLASARREVAGDPEARVSLAFDEAYLRVLVGDAEGARRVLEGYLAARPALRGYVLREPLLRGLVTPAPAAP